MKDLDISCPYCDESLSVTSADMGFDVTCPSCNEVFFIEKESPIETKKKFQGASQAQSSKKISSEKNKENLCSEKLDALRRVLCYSNINPNNHDSFRSFPWLGINCWGWCNYFVFWGSEFGQFTFTLYRDEGLWGWLRGASHYSYVPNLGSLGYISWIWRFYSFLVTILEIYGCGDMA